MVRTPLTEDSTVSNAEPKLVWVMVRKRWLSILDGFGTWLSNRDNVPWPSLYFDDYKMMIDYYKKKNANLEALKDPNHHRRSCARVDDEITYEGVNFSVARLLGRPIEEYVEVVTYDTDSDADDYAESSQKPYQTFREIYPYDEIPKKEKRCMKPKKRAFEFLVRLNKNLEKGDFVHTETRILDDVLLSSWGEARDEAKAFYEDHYVKKYLEEFQSSGHKLQVRHILDGIQTMLTSLTPKDKIKDLLVHHLVLEEIEKGTTYPSYAALFRSYTERVNESHRYGRKTFENLSKQIDVENKIVKRRQKNDNEILPHGNALDAETKETIDEFLKDLGDRSISYPLLNKLARAYKALKGDKRKGYCGRTAFLQYAKRQKVVDYIVVRS